MRDSEPQVAVPHHIAPFELLEAKLCIPTARPGSVPRVPLVNRLRASRTTLVTVLAPAGYGKTTVLAQWADRDERPFAWVTLDDDDNDPLLLARYVASSLVRVQHVDAAVFDELAADGAWCRRTLARLTSAFFSAPSPLVLVLDDVHGLRSRESSKVVAALAQHVPDGSTLVLAGRTPPRLPLARLRAAGGLFELDRTDLALSRREADGLLRAVGVELAPAEAAELSEWTEGWAAGTYLAALSLKDGGAEARGRAAPRVDRFADEYFDLVLSRLEADDIGFLERTAVLERMCGPLCDAVLGSTDSAGRLEALARANLFLVPLDPGRTWFRYHNELRECLRGRLERREPALVPELHRRAAAWCESHGELEPAIHHARAAGDLDVVARVLGALALTVCSAREAARVEPWLEWFEGERLADYPTVALLGAWVHLLRGRPVSATRWLACGERARSLSRPGSPDGGRSLEPWIALIRGAMCRDGVEQMLVDAELALHDLGPTSPWRPTALLLRGVALVLQGDADRAEESLAEAAEAAESIGATGMAVVAHAEQALLAAERGDDVEADRSGERARALIVDAGQRDGATGVLGLAVSARFELRHGNLAQARADLAEAHDLAEGLTHALPWYAVQAQLELARLHLTMLDDDRARRCLSAAARILRVRPKLGTLCADLEALRADVEKIATPRPGRGRSMTGAELRLLPLLATHLSFREIAQQLYVSRNTVKTQAISIYRKLEASSRSEAVARATELGLVRGTPPVEPNGSRSGADFIRSG
jgi:LuxR family maltose regulon positive regulatory protein